MYRILVPTYPELKLPINHIFHSILDSLVNIARSDCQITFSSPDELIERDDYHAVFLMRGGGSMSEAHRKHYASHKILVAIWHDDVYSWRFKRFATYSRELLIWLEHSDLIFIPYLKLFHHFKAYDRFRNKIIWLPWSVSECFGERSAWSERSNKILLSGYRSWQYPLREFLYNYSTTTKGKAILDTVHHAGYGSESESDKAGVDYYTALCGYKGAISTCLIAPTDYLVAKYIEIAACGCVPFMEYNVDMVYQGFLDGMNCIVIDRNNFEEKFKLVATSEAQQIAENAMLLVKSAHLHKHRAEKVVNTIVAMLNYGLRMRSSYPG